MGQSLGFSWAIRLGGTMVGFHLRQIFGVAASHDPSGPMRCFAGSAWEEEAFNLVSLRGNPSMCDGLA